MGKVFNVILSGGSGTRLWPLSRHSKPKQFLQLFNNESLFQNTLKRNTSKVNGFALVTNKVQYNKALEQTKALDLGIDFSILEPVGRNTAPAIALAALSVSADDVLFVTPSDQMIADDHKYLSALNRAIDLAKKDFLVTFGIKPSHADTGFGYIESKGEDVVSFKEKPNLEVAKQFFESGNYLWNSGMFCFKAATFLSELEKYNPDMFSACKVAYTNSINGDILEQDMLNIPADSIDYAVMEKSLKVKVVPSDFYWSDLGSFDALLEYALENPSLNIVNPIENCSNSYYISKTPVYASGLKDTLIVQTEDASLVLPVGESSRVKEIYNKVKSSKEALVL